MSGVRLTHKNNGSYGLPVVEELRINKDVTVGTVNHPASIWRLWTDAQLAKQGLARVDDVTQVSAGKEKSSGFTDKYTSQRIQRTFTLSDLNADAKKSRLLADVKSRRDEKINAGIEVVIKAVTYVLQTDAESRNLLSGAMSAANASHTFPASFAWRMRDNTDVELNPAETKKMGGDAFDHVNNCHEAARAHLTAIEALSTWGELDAYDLTALWPPVAPDQGI